MRRQCDRVPDGELVAYLADPDDDSLRGVRAHVAACEECQVELRAWRGLRGDLLIDDSISVDEHPGDKNLAAYCDDPESLASAVRTEIQAHLEACATCRDETKVLAGVRLEKAWAAQLPDTFEMNEDLSGNDQDVSIPHPAVLEASGWGQRLRRPGVLFAVFLVLSLPAIGMYTLESGVVLHRGGSGGDSLESLETLGEIEFDAATLTAHLRRSERDAPLAAGDAVLSAPAFAKPEIAASPMVESVGRGSSRAAVHDGSESLVRERSNDDAVAVTVVAKVQPAAPEVGVDHSASQEEQLVSTTSHQERKLGPEQLMAMLRTERHVKDLERTAIEVPQTQQGHVRSGAAVIDMSGAYSDDTDDTHDTDEAQDAHETDETADVGEVRRSVRVAPESMILGVRKLGTAPIRGTMLSSGGGVAATLDNSGLRRRSRIHFVRGSSYVFYAHEVADGLEVRFALPAVAGAVHPLDARVIEVGTSRELRRSYAAPTQPVQVGSMVSFDVPARWFSVGSYLVELTDPEDGAGGASSINIRILESSAARPAAAAPTALE